MSNIHIDKIPPGDLYKSLRDKKCTYCDFTGRHDSEMRDHLKMVHFNRKFKCRCKETFQNMEELHNHQRLRHRDSESGHKILITRFTPDQKAECFAKRGCMFCDTTYPEDLSDYLLYQRINSHVNNVHLDTAEKCPVCGQILQNRKKLKKHMHRHQLLFLFQTLTNKSISELYFCSIDPICCKLL